MDVAALELERDGAQRLAGAGSEAIEPVEAAVRHLPRDAAGHRIAGLPALRPLLSAEGAVGMAAARVLGPATRPVRAILFDKSAAQNWSLGWHQDRTICVRERIESPGFGPWTLKQGIRHVAPPADLLARMVTLRLHLDDVPIGNAPLLVAPGSHRLGRIAEPEIDAVVARCGVRACVASRGDIWLYATLILHASEAARMPSRRRVLQVDYSAEDLPGGLEWLGVGPRLRSGAGRLLAVILGVEREEEYHDREADDDAERQQGLLGEDMAPLMVLLGRILGHGRLSGEAESRERGEGFPEHHRSSQS
jgi:hypothetical protein